MTELRVETLVLPGARIGEENPLPIFRDPQVDVPVPLRDSVPEDKRRYFGFASGRRVLPYRLQDRYSRHLEPYAMRTVVLENELLKATFWVELGGRLMSLIYKPLERELLHNNPIFQPANLAIRNAWFAGGIEWNVGQYGHTFFTCSPVFAAAIQDGQGEPGLRLYEYERCKNLYWQTDFTLPAGSPYLVAFTRVVNAQDFETSLYWWTNIAVPERPGVRVLAPTNEALYIDAEISGYGQACMPDLPSLPGKDASYSLNWPAANEFFFQCQQADLPWEAALDENGEGLVEASTRPLGARKLFCWGTHQGGRHWQDFLGIPGQPYIEIQAGLAPTQRHSLPMPGRSELHWTEVFGYLHADPGEVHSTDWETAWRAADGELKKQVTAHALAAIEEACLQRADQPSGVILQMGSGWGALERARQAAQGDGIPAPEAFAFPAASQGSEQRRWLALLEQGQLADQPAGAVPGDWMVQPQWRQLLADSLTHEQNRNGYALLHYGVMLAEAFDDDGAEAAWREALIRQPSPWVARCLGALAKRRGDTAQALNYYTRSWNLAAAQGAPAAALALEYLSALSEAGDYEKAWQVCQELSPDVLEFDPLQVLRANIAMQVGELDAVDAALRREYASVREGVVTLTELWFELWRRRMAQQSGRDPAQISEEEIEALYPSPPTIDFRMAG